ncbi:hypothetical protein B0H63DRAFT_526253 [Podospora didyma]|uniref:BRCT domain-containing protein n=1 Tax=Podospora didyma TaxID=330526 RepID=A0AAE0KDQ5_9PEZI|nr:hypothetical protein B0H63DRAFT_526253 [Podospora didyma]
MRTIKPKINLTKKEKSMFDRITVAVVGEFSGQWLVDNIARWVGLRGGKFIQQMDESVTHLVCSKVEFKKKGAKVKAALGRGKTCYIVTVDWLEDSMHAKRKLSEENYSLAKWHREKRAKKKQEERIARGLELAEKAVNPNLFNVFSDSESFKYEKIALTRDNGKGGVERYELAFYQSKAQPYLYWFVAKYYKKKGDNQPKFHRPSETSGTFRREFKLFKDFFHKKTGISWEQRLVRCGGEANNKKLFQYLPPTRGKPIGCVPRRFLPPDDPMYRPPTTPTANAATTTSSMNTSEDPAPTTLADSTVISLPNTSEDQPMQVIATPWQASSTIPVVPPTPVQVASPTSLLPKAIIPTAIQTLPPPPASHPPPSTLSITTTTETNNIYTSLQVSRSAPIDETNEAFWGPVQSAKAADREPDDEDEDEDREPDEDGNDDDDDSESDREMDLDGPPLQGEEAGGNNPKPKPQPQQSQQTNYSSRSFDDVEDIIIID